MKYLYIPFSVYFKSKLLAYFSNKRLLFILLSLDLLLMLVHTLSSLGYLPDNYNSYISNNFGYGEMFQYFKCIVLCVLLIRLFIKQSQTVFLWWALIFVYILLDDSLEVHELLGAKMASIDFIGNKTFGEFVVFLAVGLILLLPLFLLHINLRKTSTKIFNQDMSILFGLLIVAGVGMDILHDFPESHTFMKGFLTMLEDGGEMVAISLIVWYVLSFTKEHKPENILMQH